jgi:hypothetical protein
VVRFGLFLSSYAPLFVILAIRFRRPELVVACAVLAVAGLLAVLWILWAERSKARAAYTIEKVDDKGPEVAGYLASYLLPFLTVAEPANPEVVAYAIFLGVAAIVYVQSDMLQINPIFYLLGRRVVRVTTSTDWRGYLITRDRPLKNETIEATTLSTGVLVRAATGVGR